MLDIGWQELLVLGAVGLVIFPPKTYPEILRNIMLVVNRMRRAGEEVRDTLEAFAETSSVQNLRSEFQDTKRIVEDEAERLSRQVEQSPKIAKPKSQSKPKPKPKSKLKIEPKSKPKPKSKLKSKLRLTTRVLKK